MQKTIFSNVAWRFLKGLSQFFCMILIVRNIDISDYGWYISAVSAFELMAIISIPGIVKIALRSALANDERFQNLFTLKILMLPMFGLGFVLIPDKLATFFFLAIVADHISMFARVKLNQNRNYFVFNLLENSKPILLILLILIYLGTYNSDLSLLFLSIIYFSISILLMILNILAAYRLAGFNLRFEKPSYKDFTNSVYASGNGLIATAVRRGAIMIAALSFSYTDAAYLNIALQFLTIFTMIYSGISLSLTRDIYDLSINFNQLRNYYSLPILGLIFSILFSSVILYFYGSPLIGLIFGNDAIEASKIVYMAPIIVLLQLPQLILMGIFMRQRRERLILILNVSMILIFVPISILYATNVIKLMYVILIFVFMTSILYIFTYKKNRKVLAK